MTLIETARDWLESLPATVGYRYSLGAWTEEAGRIIALWQEPGRRNDEEAYPVVRLVFIGDRNARSDALVLMALAEAVEAAALVQGCTGRAVRVTPLGGIVGPGYTAEGRAWVELTLEFLI